MAAGKAIQVFCSNECKITACPLHPVNDQTRSRLRVQYKGISPLCAYKKDGTPNPNSPAVVCYEYLVSLTPKDFEEQSSYDIQNMNPCDFSECKSMENIDYTALSLQIKEYLPCSMKGCDGCYANEETTKRIEAEQEREEYEWERRHRWDE